MDCPVCGNPLHQVRTESAHYHVCRTCHGIWTPAEFLPSIVRLASPRSAPRNAPRDHAGTVGRTRGCPACRGKMEKSNYSFDSGVTIDRCRRCNGIWLDAHEAQEIAAYLDEDDSRELAAQALCEEVRQTHDLHEALDIDGQDATLANIVRFTPGASLTVAGIVPLPDLDDWQPLPWALIAIAALHVLAMLVLPAMPPDQIYVIPTYGVILFRDLSAATPTVQCMALFTPFHPLLLLVDLAALLSLGAAAEARLGHAGFLAAYAAFALLAAVSQFIFDVAFQVVQGTIFGLLGVYCVAFPQKKITALKLLPTEFPALVLFGGWLAVQFMAWMLISLSEGPPLVPYGAAFTCVAGGLALGIPVKRRARDLAMNPLRA